MGLGARLLDSIYSHYKGDATVVDVTVEVGLVLLHHFLVLPLVAQDPSDNFVRLRDFVDAKNCLKLAAFSKDQVCFQSESAFKMMVVNCENVKVVKGFTEKMAEAAAKELKICKKQVISTAANCNGLCGNSGHMAN